MKPTKLLTLTLSAMVAFASNSLLCRAALRQTNIDAASFTLVRIASGAAALWLIMQIRGRLRVDGTPSASAALVERRETITETESPSLSRRGEWSLKGRSLLQSSAQQAGNWFSAFALFAYAAAFSFAYNTLSAGTGALLLFGAVQATMILWGLRKGERLHARQITGLVAALAGLVVLVFPGLSAPPFAGSILMLGAGVAWGVYSLRGKNSGDPGYATAGNFLRAVPLAAFLSIAFIPWTRFDGTGALYAALSGSLASGVGYVIWYAALPGLKAASAATVQLSVPVLAATGGILLLGETITGRFVFAAIAVLGGIALVVIEKQRLA